MNDKQLYRKLGRKVRELESDLADYLHGLEESVEKRTCELEAANRKLKAEISDRKKIEIEREKMVRELQTALADVKTLSDLLPICSVCKKIC